MFGMGRNDAAIDAFAQEICMDLAKRFPPEKESQLSVSRGKVGAKLGKAFADLQVRVAKFQEEHQLGVYGKARLLREIRDGLTAKAYSHTFVSATTDLLLHTGTKGPK